jgi:SAM-dependent methyltransferase
MALEDWLRVAETGTDDDVREWILTGTSSGKPFTPYVPTVALPAGVSSVLDFGCGLGRNFPYLTTVAERVAGFDLPPMVARCRTAPGAAGVVLYDDWTAVRRESFDLIFASLVLQHLDTPSIAARLADFAHMAPSTYVITRADSDSGDRVLGVVARLDLFDTGECVEVEHDDRTHQLRVVSHLPFEQAEARAAGHFEVVLRSRIPTKTPGAALG